MLRLSLFCVFLPSLPFGRDGFFIFFSLMGFVCFVGLFLVFFGLPLKHPTGGSGLDDPSLGGIGISSVSRSIGVGAVTSCVWNGGTGSLFHLLSRELSLPFGGLEMRVSSASEYFLLLILLADESFWILLFSLASCSCSSDSCVFGGFGFFGVFVFLPLGGSCLGSGGCFLHFFFLWILWGGCHVRLLV